MDKLARRLLGWCILLISAGVYGASLLPATLDISQISNTDGAYQILHDLSASITIETLLSHPDQSLWQDMQGDVSRGVLTHPVWMRFRLSNSDPNQTRYILEHTDPGPYRIDLYIVDSQGVLVSEQHYHRESPYWERPFPNPGPVFSVEVDTGQEYVMYARIQATFGGLFSQFAVWTPNDFVRHETRETLLYGGAYTAFILFSFLSLLVFLAIRERTFLSYSALTFTSCMLLMNLDAHWAVLFQSGGAPVGNATFWGGIYYFAALTFARDYLKLDQVLPLVGKIYLSLMAFGPVIIVLGILGYAEAAGVFMMLTGPILLTIPFLALYLCVVKKRQVKLFTLAWFIYGTAVLIQFGLRQVGLIEHQPLTIYTGVLGGVIEMCLLAVSMGFKILDIKQQRDKAREAYVTQLESFSEQLERQVKEKTWELEVARAQAEKEARTDSLTRLYNRRAFEELAGNKFSSVTRHRKMLATILVDIDKFKQVNDKLGHKGGDLVLKAVAEALQSLVRESDVLARIGGEEFAILAETDDLNGAFQFCERLRRAVAELEIEVDKEKLKTSISLGCYCCYAPQDISLMLNKADTAMYRSKQLGRNKTTLWQPEKRQSGI